MPLNKNQSTLESPLKIRRTINLLSLSQCYKILLSEIAIFSFIVIRYILHRFIGLAVKVFANGPEDRSSFPGRVILKTQKMVLDPSLLNTQHYKVWIKGKVEQSREWSSALPSTAV